MLIKMLAWTSKLIKFCSTDFQLTHLKTRHFYKEKCIAGVRKNRLSCKAKLCSSWLLFKLAVTVFWLCRPQYRMWLTPHPTRVPHHQPLYGVQPSKHETWIQCWINVGPPSATLAQHWSNIGSMSRERARNPIHVLCAWQTCMETSSDVSLEITVVAYSSLQNRNGGSAHHWTCWMGMI